MPAELTKSFDYKTAWKELAYPSFLALSPEIRSAFANLCQNGREWNQDRWLEVQATPEFRETLSALPLRALANAARTIYFFGHWYSKDRSNLFEQDIPDGPPQGAHWKFSNVADQVLADALGMKRNRIDSGRGISFRIIEGWIRACWSDKDSWTWEEIAPACLQTLEAIRAVSTSPISYSSAQAYFKALKVAVAPLLTPEEAAWSDTGRFMVDDCPSYHKPLSAGPGVCDECRTKLLAQAEA
jgi:hypothetical protein